MSLLTFMGRGYDATVSTVHSFSKDPEHIVREADIVGVPNLVGGSWLKPGAVVNDVGTCHVELNVMLLN